MNTETKENRNYKGRALKVGSVTILVAMVFGLAGAKLAGVPVWILVVPLLLLAVLDVEQTFSAKTTLSRAVAVAAFHFIILATVIAAHGQIGTTRGGAASSSCCGTGGGCGSAGGCGSGACGAKGKGGSTGAGCGCGSSNAGGTAKTTAKSATTAGTQRTASATAPAGMVPARPVLPRGLSADKLPILQRNMGSGTIPGSPAPAVQQGQPPAGTAPGAPGNVTSSGNAEAGGVAVAAGVPQGGGGVINTVPNTAPAIENAGNAEGASANAQGGEGRILGAEPVATGVNPVIRPAAGLPKPNATTFPVQPADRNIRVTPQGTVIPLAPRQPGRPGQSFPSVQNPPAQISGVPAAPASLENAVPKQGEPRGGENGK